MHNQLILHNRFMMHNHSLCIIKVYEYAMAWHGISFINTYFSLEKHSKVYLNLSILDMAFLFINHLKQFLGKLIV